MPLLLYRYILGDLLKVFALTAFILVTVIAFGATIKPLTDQGLMGAGEAVRYMIVAMVPMLQFALPFAAGFASTIVLHRLSSDNEILAAAASGISYRKLLAPIVALGIALTLVMVVLTQSIIPRTEAQLGRMLVADVTRKLAADVESGVPSTIGNLQIYAEDMRIVRNPPDTDAQSRLILSRVAVAELDGSGRVDTDVTAARAVVDVYRPGAETYLKLLLSDTVAYEASTGQLAGSSLVEPPRAYAMPSPLRDNLRAMTRAQMLALREEPERHGRVREAKEALARLLLDHSIALSIKAQLTERGTLELVQRGPAQRRYIVHADSFRDGVFTNRNGSRVQVAQLEGASELRRIAAEEVRLSRIREAAALALFELELINAEVTDHQAGGLVNRRARLADHGLALAGLTVNDPAEEPLAALIDRAGDVPGAQRAVNLIGYRISSLDKEITARLFSRHSQAVTAVLLLTLGGTLAMWLRGTLPLVIYAWAFLPSIINLIMISGGEKMMRDGNLLGGLGVMWGGNAALLLIFLFAYWRLSRN